jgi:hypothetical protein
VALDADLLVFFQPGGWGIAMSVLLRRGADGPEEAVVRLAADIASVLAIDETFYEPLPLASIDAALRDGLVIEAAAAPQRRWVRTRRTLHVFSERPGVAGFASLPRVVIGQENVVLCTTEACSAVLDLCRATGADTPLEVAGSGIPAGWQCFRNYWPKRPASLDGVEEFLLALNPMPDAAIELCGGIPVGRSTWIADRPPVIRLIGAEATEGEVTIDGGPAVHTEQGWMAPGWNAPGRHLVRYLGLSRSYEIAVPEDRWDFWPAHQAEGLYACGAAVTDASGTRSLVLRVPGCWLLGPQPGQIAWAAPSAYGSAIATPLFDPVWAILPRVGRTRPRPRMLVHSTPPLETSQGTPQAALRQWREILRNSVAKLQDLEADALWQQYRRAASALKERRRR